MNKLSIKLKLILAFFSLVIAESKFNIRYDNELSWHIADKHLVGNWRLGADAALNADFVRLTDLQPYQEGWLISSKPLSHGRWTVELFYRINGGLSGGEGMAVWFLGNNALEPPHLMEGSLWNGLAIIIDSHTQDGNNRLFILHNDGSQLSNPLQDEHRALGSCLYNSRNKDQSMVRITYDGSSLQVDVLVTEQFSTWVACSTVPIVLEQSNYIMAVSAATSEFILDLHSVLQMSVYNLMPKDTNSVNVESATIQPIEQNSHTDEEDFASKDINTELQAIVAMNKEIISKYEQLQSDLQVMTSKHQGSGNTINSIVSKFEVLKADAQSAEAKVAYRADVVNPETGFSPEDINKLRNVIGQLKHLSLEKLEDLGDKVVEDLVHLSEQFDVTDWEYRKFANSHRNSKLWQEQRVDELPKVYGSQFTWMNYVFIAFFEAAWILAMVWWRKHRVENAKKHQ